MSTDSESDGLVIVFEDDDDEDFIIVNGEKYLNVVCLSIICTVESEKLK